MRITRRGSLVLLIPLAVLLVATLVIPTGTVFAYSFFDFELLRPQPGFSLEHYGNVVTDETYRTLAWNTLKVAVPTTLVSTVAGFALAYFIALRPGRSRMILLALVVASMLASYLGRIYAWRTLLGTEGILSGLIRQAGIGDGAPDFLLFSHVAVVIGQVNFLLPFTTLVLFAGLSGIAGHLRDAGRDLGASPTTILLRVTIPLAGPALLAAITFTFFLSAGDYLTPQLLGPSQGSLTIGASIADQLRTTGNIPLGSALSFVLMAVFGLVYWLVRQTMSRAGWLPRGVGQAQS